MAAHALQQADYVYGVRARLGPAQATVAVAYALARVVGLSHVEGHGGI